MNIFRNIQFNAVICRASADNDDRKRCGNAVACGVRSKARHGVRPDWKHATALRMTFDGGVCVLTIAQSDFELRDGTAWPLARYDDAARSQ